MDLLSFANILAALIAIAGSFEERKLCNPRYFEHGSLVCVCNVTYCDNLEPFKEGSLPKNVFLHFESNKQGFRMRRTVGVLSWKSFQHVADEETAHLRVDHNLEYQEMFGFGGTLTDATAINMAALSPDLQETLVRFSNAISTKILKIQEAELLRMNRKIITNYNDCLKAEGEHFQHLLYVTGSLFSSDGLGYNMIRVPMGSTEYSPRNYTYDDGNPDPELSHFKLPEEDTDYKIPFLDMVKLVDDKHTQLIGCPWRAPQWMYVDGRIHPDHYQSWANYYVKFLQSYDKAGTKFWGVSTQNEIGNSNWTSKEHYKWIHNYLAPSLEKAGYSYLRTVFLDDERRKLSEWMEEIETEMIEDIDVIALHWINDTVTTANLLDDAHALFPDKSLLYTQASFSGETEGGQAVQLGNWEYAETYTSAVIEVLNHWIIGWMEMSMVMNVHGGPSCGTKSSDASIIVNITANEFYKQPTYYINAHFSKFLSKGARRIGLVSHDDKGIQSVAFKTPGNSVIIVMLNKKEVEIHTVVDDAQHGRLEVFLPARSVHTLVYTGGSDHT